LADDLRRHLAGEPVKARPAVAVPLRLNWSKLKEPLSLILVAGILLLGIMIGATVAVVAVWLLQGKG
jgi:hypothetical protein